MKLPFDFGVKLIFRLVIPGFFLCLGLIPLLNITLNLIGWTSKFEYAFIILVVFAGWVITICDMRIYMLFEGRRYWPTPVQTYFRKREQVRLAKLIERSKSSDELVSREAYFDLRNFPMNATDDYAAPYPFRLGNLLTAFEQYSSRTYGIDSIFYWPRIWLRIDKDSREEIDNTQALADSTIYTSFAFYFSGLIWLLYLLLRFVGHVVIRESSFIPAQFPSLIVTVDRLLPHKLAAFLASIGFISAGFVIYRLSLSLHAQFGEYFKSVFDTHAGKIDVSEVINELSKMSANSPVVCLTKVLTRDDQFRIAARYLQYQRYRCPNPQCNALLKPNEIETHVCSDFSKES